MRTRLARREPVRHWPHKDFVDAVRDAAERSGLPVARGKGKRGRPRIAAGPDLAAGQLSEAEYVDFDLERPVTPAVFGRRLQSCLPEGVDVLWQRRIPPTAPHLRAGVTGMRYEVRESLDPGHAEAFAQADEWPFTRCKGDKEKRFDLKRSVSRLQVKPGHVTIDIEVSNEGTPKVEEVVRSVFGLTAEQTAGLTIVRTAVRQIPAPWPDAAHME